MAAAAIEELRRIRTAQADEPERVVQLGTGLVNKAGKAAAGDECMSSCRTCSLLTLVDWTILDQVAVAALITSNDALATVEINSLLRVGLMSRVVLKGLRISSRPRLAHSPSSECNSKPKKNLTKPKDTTTTS